VIEIDSLHFAFSRDSRRSRQRLKCGRFSKVMLQECYPCPPTFF
jgi:hypothetical protein